MNPALSKSFQLKLPNPLLSVIQRCEINCVAGCCGVDAFDRQSVHMIPWFRENPDRFSLVLDQLSDTLRLVGEQPGSIWSDELEFNHGWLNAKECLEYLREWRLLILQAVEAERGRSFRSLDPNWRTSTVLALAQGIYDERAFDRLPILADALEDAGCDNEEMLAHCRGAGPHARGCWVVDLVLGKA
jgi:uncharacterized protein DUF6331